MKRILIIFCLGTAMLTTGGDIHAQTLRDAWKQLKSAVSTDNGRSQATHSTSNDPIVIKEIKAIGNPRTGEIVFELLLHCNRHNGTTFSTYVTKAIDENGTEAISYTVSRIDNPEPVKAPVVEGEDTRMRLSAMSSIVVNPQVQTLRSVQFAGIKSPVTSIPIEWKAQEVKYSLYPAEHYLVENRNVYKGTEVLPFTGRMVIEPTQYYGENRYYTYSKGGELYLCGIVGDRATGNVRIIVNVKGQWDGDCQMFDSDGNAISGSMEKFFGATSWNKPTEIYSKILKINVSVDSFQKITINNCTFKNVPIQWIDVK